jgi:hypothetical protein
MCWGFARRAVTATTTVTGADRGYTIDCTSGTYDVAITAAATLGSGFPFGVYNSGSGTATVNPNASETLRTPSGTVATIALTQGQGLLILCDGTNFEVIAAVGLYGGSTISGLTTGRIVDAASSTTIETAAAITTDQSLAVTGGVTLSASGLTLTDVNVALSATTGTKIGTATTQKLGFYNSAPVVQPTGDVLTALAAGKLGLVASPTISATALTGIVPSANGGTGVNNAGTITNASNTTITGGGTLALGGFTLTVPATGTAALLATANNFSAAQTVSNTLHVTGDATMDGNIIMVSNKNIQMATNGSFLSLIGGVTLASDPGFQIFGSTYGSGVSGRLYMDCARHVFRGINGATTGVLELNSTVDATATNAASIITAGGVGVALRSFLGTIGSTFSGNVLAGVQDGTAAVAGQVGQEIKSTVSGVAVAGSGSVGNVTSISLTAGDWLMSGYVVISGGATGLTSGSTAKLSIVSTTATNGTSGDTMVQESVYALIANGLVSLALPAKRINISSTTTYYMTVETTYVAGSPTVAGTLTATRVR